jgi:hypothetical protein
MQLDLRWENDRKISVLGAGSGVWVTWMDPRGRFSNPKFAPDDALVCDIFGTEIVLFIGVAGCLKRTGNRSAPQQCRATLYITIRYNDRDEHYVEWTVSIVRTVWFS